MKICRCPPFFIERKQIQQKRKKNAENCHRFITDTLQQIAEVRERNIIQNFTFRENSLPVGKTKF